MYGIIVCQLSDSKVAVIINKKIKIFVTWTSCSFPASPWVSLVFESHSQDQKYSCKNRFSILTKQSKKVGGGHGIGWG